MRPLKEYRSDVEGCVSEAQGLYREIQDVISPELRERAKALVDRKQQLLDEATSQDNVVVERLQGGWLACDLFDQVGIEYQLLRAIAPEQLQPVKRK